MDHLLTFTACGLVYDAAGVILLGFAFFLKSKEMLSKEAGTYFDMNPHLLRGLITSTFDGRVGTILLFCGFVFQFFGNLHTKVENSIIIACYLILVLVLIVHFFVIRKKIVNEWCDDLTKSS